MKVENETRVDLVRTKEKKWGPSEGGGRIKDGAYIYIYVYKYISFLCSRLALTLHTFFSVMKEDMRMQITSVVARVIRYLWAARACGPRCRSLGYPPP